jgi:hypothetical protein
MADLLGRKNKKYTKKFVLERAKSVYVERRDLTVFFLNFRPNFSRFWPKYAVFWGYLGHFLLIIARIRRKIKPCIFSPNSTSNSLCLAAFSFKFGQNS